jgi:hypothetical protein
MVVVVRPATPEDIAAFCHDLPSKPTIRALVAEIDGVMVGFGGIGLKQGRWYAFCDVNPELRPYKMTIARAAKRFLAAARAGGIRTIYAEISPLEPRAGLWLASLGFEFDERSQHFYRWSGDA